MSTREERQEAVRRKLKTSPVGQWVEKFGRWPVRLYAVLMLIPTAIVAVLHGILSLWPALRSFGDQWAHEMRLWKRTAARFGKVIWTGELQPTTLDDFLDQ